MSGCTLCAYVCMHLYSHHTSVVRRKHDHIYVMYISRIWSPCIWYLSHTALVFEMIMHYFSAWRSTILNNLISYHLAIVPIRCITKTRVITYVSIYPNSAAWLCYLITPQKLCKTQSSASLAFVRGIHRSPVNSLHKWPVTRKMVPFYDVIMIKRLVDQN